MAITVRIPTPLRTLTQGKDEVEAKGKNVRADYTLVDAREPRQHDGEAQGAGDRREPAQDRVPAERGEIGWEQEDARADHVADDERDAHRKAELSRRRRHSLVV